MFACKNVFVQGGGLGSPPEWSHRLLLDCPTSIPQHFPLPVSFELGSMWSHTCIPRRPRVSQRLFSSRPQFWFRRGLSCDGGFARAHPNVSYGHQGGPIYIYIYIYIYMTSSAQRFCSSTWPFPIQTSCTWWCTHDCFCSSHARMAAVFMSPITRSQFRVREWIVIIVHACTKLRSVYEHMTKMYRTHRKRTCLHHSICTYHAHSYTRILVSVCKISLYLCVHVCIHKGWNCEHACTTLALTTWRGFCKCDFCWHAAT